MLLEDMYDYKNRFMRDILTNKNIVDLLVNTSDDIAAGAEGFDPKDLLYTQVFPYEYIPETVEVGRTYICCEVDIQKSIGTNNALLYLPVIYVWVMSHKSILRLPNGGGVRTDRVCSEIEKTIEGSMYYGLGKLELYAVKRFAPMVDYNGKVMIYHAKEIKSVFDPNKDIPKNRKEL